MAYYQDIVTQKSWQILKSLRQKYKFVLIGGWAVWLYTKALKSKDIDIIVEFDTLGMLRKEHEIVKNDRLKKYEARVQEVDIDIYLPYFSNPGLPPEVIQSYLSTKEGFIVPNPEVLLILKQYVYEQRKSSIKGQKDKIDIISLLTLDLDFDLYRRVLKEVKQEKLRERLQGILQRTTRVRELNLGNHKMAKLKKKILASIE